jgi:hypothetical protein
MGIETELRAYAGRLAAILGWPAAEAEAVVVAAARGNRVSTAATAACIAEMLEALSAEGRRAWLTQERLERLRTGELEHVSAALHDHLAGPYDVAWDGNWPSCYERLRGRMPPGVRPGDIVLGGDGGGTRISIEVAEHPEGGLTGEHLRRTWRDPPFEEYWLDTYSRLAARYPEEIPPPPGG